MQFAVGWSGSLNVEEGWVPVNVFIFLCIKYICDIAGLESESIKKFRHLACLISVYSSQLWRLESLIPSANVYFTHHVITC